MEEQSWEGERGVIVGNGGQNIQETRLACHVYEDGQSDGRAGTVNQSYMGSVAWRDKRLVAKARKETRGYSTSLGRSSPPMPF